MGRPARIKSYYAASAHAAPDRVELESSVDCDGCVVGGGIAGCSTALHLAQNHFDVVLLEEYRIVWDVSVEGLALMRELIARYHIDCDWTDGYLLTAVRKRHLQELRTELDALQNKLGYATVRYVHVTLNRAPHFGRLASNIYFLQGFSGHGIALTGIAGKLVAQAIAGTAERFDIFARIPHHNFPGGSALRQPVLALAMLYYRLRDLL